MTDDSGPRRDPAAGASRERDGRLPIHPGRTVVLGGVGGDAHTVGLIILRHGLRRAGYRVHYLGIQSELRDFCEAAQHADAVLVSNLDGHAALYLEDLPGIREAVGGASALWYLGGNPSLTRSAEDGPALKALGFDRVFLDFVSCEEVIELLGRDLAGRRRNSADLPEPDVAPEHPALPNGLGDDRPVTLFDQRSEVLANWETGQQAADLARNADRLYRSRWLASVQREAAAAGRLLIHPRCGVGDPREQLSIFHALKEAGADVLSFQVDSMTRNNAYRDVCRVLATASSDGQNRLNGFPVINHGPDAVFELTSAVSDLPLQVRHSTRDPRLLAEISFAAGVSGFEGGALCYNLPYFKDYPVAQSLRRWRYVDDLAGFYRREFGVILDREFFGVLTATLIPPCIAVSVVILEALLAAEAGVKSVSLGYAEQGCVAQDAAAIIALRRLAQSYLTRSGHPDVAVHTVFHQFMGAFPLSPDRAEQLVVSSARTAKLSGSDRVMTKTPVEALRIPGPAENARAIRSILAALDSDPDVPPSPAEIDAHVEEIVQETRAILDSVLRLQEDSLLMARIDRAVEVGIIDIPFSPSIWNAGRAVTARDVSGAVRFHAPGGIPLPEHIAKKHRSLIDERLMRSSLTLDRALENDVLFFAGEAWQ